MAYLLRRMHNIMASKLSSFEGTFKYLYGTRAPIPDLVHGPDINRQNARWDAYVGETDKNFLKTTHATLQYVLAWLVSLICATGKGSAVDSARERKYLATAILRDFIDQAMQCPRVLGRMAGLPFQDVVLPISSEGKLSEVKHALQRIDAGTEFINWWNAVVAEDIVLPVKLISNSANCSCFITF